MSTDARVARAIQDVRRALAAHPPAEPLRVAVEDLIDEAADAVHMTDEDIDNY